MNIDVFEFVNFNSIYFILSIAFSLLSFFLFFLFRRYAKNYFFKFLSLATFWLTFIFDFILFFNAIQEQPVYDHGFIVTVLIPTIIILFCVIFITILLVIYVIGTLEGISPILRNYVRFVYVLIKISYCFAYGSAVAIILTVFEFLLTIAKVKILSISYSKKMKTD